MGNGIENGNSSSEGQHPVIPQNGLFQIGNSTFRSINGEIFRVRTGEELVREMNRGEDEYMDRTFRVASLLRSPMSEAPEGAQTHTG